MRTFFVIVLLGLFSLNGRAQSTIDSIIVTFTNVSSVSSRVGVYTSYADTSLLSCDQHNIVITRVNFRASHSLLLTGADKISYDIPITIEYDSIAAVVSSIVYHHIGGIPYTVLDSTFELLNLAMHRTGDHFHSEFHGADVTSHMNVRAWGRHDGGNITGYDQTVIFNVTDSSGITVDLYANILSEVTDHSTQLNGRLIVSPSVASNYTTVLLPNDDINATITLSDVVGRTLASYRFSEPGDHIIPLSSMTQGIYLITDSKGRAARLVVAR